MLISDQKNFIFVHIYKTGGSSLTRILGPHVDEHYRSKTPRTEGNGWQGTWHYRGRQHAKLETLATDPAWKARDLHRYRVCAFVRNPYTWALSVWNDFYKRENEAAEWSRSFPAYCQLIRAARAGQNPDLWGSYPQVSFLAHPVLKPAFVGRFERLREDAAKLLELLEIPASDLPHEIEDHPARRADFLAFYDAESLSIVNELFAADFQAFGYEIIRD